MTVENLFYQIRTLLLLLVCFNCLCSSVCPVPGVIFTSASTYYQYYKHIEEGHSTSSFFDLFFKESLLIELSEITGFSYVWLKFYWSYVGLWGHIVLSRSSQHTLIYSACQLKWCSTFLLQTIAVSRVSWMWMTENCFLRHSSPPQRIAYLL